MKNINKVAKTGSEKTVTSKKNVALKKKQLAQNEDDLEEEVNSGDSDDAADSEFLPDQDDVELEPEYLGQEGFDGDSADLPLSDDANLGACIEGFEEACFLGPEVSTAPDRAVKDGLTLYLREISKFPMLKPEEEVMLAKRVKEFNDSDAAFRLVSSHLRLVVRIAMDFQRRWMQNVLDLIQEGNVGLLRAANKFDSDKGIKFSYYAAFWIKAYILKFIMDNWRMVKIGTTQTQRKLFYNLNKERQKLIAQGFDPDNKTLAENLGVSEENIVEMTQRMDGGDVSLDVPIGDESNATRMEFLPALGPGTEEGLASSQLAGLLHEQLEKILPSLSDKERDILQNRLLSDEPITLREIGAKYKITRERVRQIETRLLQKLHTHLSKEIKDFSEDWIRH